MKANWKCSEWNVLEWNWKNQGWGLLGVLVGMVAVTLVVGWLSAPAPEPQRIPVTQEQVSEVFDKHLGWAEAASQSGVEAGMTPIRQFFAEARTRSRDYAKEVLGFHSKWTLVNDYISGTKEHEAYLQERFGAFLFTPEELEGMVRGSIDGYLTHLRDVDSELLVRLQADLAEVPSGSFSVEVDQERIQVLLAEALQSASEAAELELQGAVGRELVSLTASEILTVIGVRMMTSAGILSAGTGTGMLSFGAGLVASIATDFVVSEIYDQMFDPAGELSRTIDAKLSEVETLIVQGSEESPGLESFLKEYGERRNRARQAALDAAFLGSSAIAIDLE